MGGELLVRGPGMLQGYYKKPEATRAAFHGDWFRTGDLFRQDERGYFYIVGRVKDMIRRAGENIAAREVEAVLRGMPEIREAAAVPVPDERRGEEVKAYILLQPGLTPADAPPERIIAHCEANLAPFKVPLHLGEQVSTLAREPDGRWRAGTTGGKTFLARTVFLAAGVGAFVPKKLGVDGAEAYEGHQLFYHPSDFGRFAGLKFKNPLVSAG